MQKTKRSRETSGGREWSTLAEGEREGQERVREGQIEGSSGSSRQQEE